MWSVGDYANEDHEQNKRNQVSLENIFGTECFYR